MRITFIIPGYPWKPVGGFRVVYEYSNHLVQRGHKVTVVHTRRLSNWPPPDNFYDWLHRKAVNFRDCVFKPDVRWQPIDNRVSMLYVPEPEAKYIPDGDAVVATAWGTAEYIVRYPSEKGKKFYLSMDFYPFLGIKEKIEATWRLPLKKIAMSHWIKDMICKSGVKDDDVSIIPCGIDIARFRCINDIIKRPSRILMFYSRATYKSAETGIKAMQIVKSEYATVHGVCFGPTRIPVGIPQWMEYSGNISDSNLVKLYNNSSIFLSSSIAEGFAFPPAESMACGCAVAATDCGGIREYAKHEKTALLSPPGNPEMLADNLLRLLKDDSLRIQLATAGHKQIQKFTWEHSTDLLERLLIYHENP